MNNSAMNSRRTKRPFRLAVWVLALTMLGTVLAGCTVNTRPEPEKKKSTVQLKVLYNDRESFYRDYGNFILLRMPDIEFKVVPTDGLYGGDRPLSENLAKLVVEQQPDLLILPRTQQQVLQRNNQLLPLSGLLSDKALANVPDNVKKLLYSGGEGDGELYGVAVSLSSEALFYNKDLFASNGIPAPEGWMSWESFADLARRFAGSPSAGFYSLDSRPDALMMRVGASNGLARMNKEGTALTLDTDGWAQVLETIKPLYEDKVVLEKDVTLFDDPFLNREAAMTIRGTEYYRQMERTEVPFEWGVLPVPSSDQSHIRLDLLDVLSVNRNTVNAEAAARVVDFIMSDPLNVLEKSVKSALPATLESPIARDPQHPLHYLYTQPANPNAGANQERIQGLSDHYFMAQSDYEREQVRKMVNDQLDIREGLRSIEEFGNALLKEERSRTE